MSVFPPPFGFVPALTPANLSARRCPVALPRASKRILIMRLAAHGDILMATPLLTALRDAYPDAWITWIAGDKEQDAIDAHPCLDEILIWRGRRWKLPLRTGLFPVWLAWALRLRAELKRRRYDLFLSFQPEEWPLLTRAVRADLSIGVFDTFRQFNGGKPTSTNTRLFTTAFTHPDLPEHRTDQYLLPLTALGLPQPDEKRMSIGYTQKDEDRINQFLSDHDIGTDDRIIVIAPMTTWPSRCWDEIRFAELGDNLAGSHHARLVLIGSKAERAAVEQIAKSFKHPPILAAGNLTFRQLAALVAKASLLISGDTGPMHLAAAVGTPYLALFGPTPIAGRAPLAGRGLALAHDVPCGPCDQKICSNPERDKMLCMRLITVEEAVNAAESLLRESVIRR